MPLQPFAYHYFYPKIHFPPGIEAKRFQMLSVLRLMKPSRDKLNGKDQPHHHQDERTGDKRQESVADPVVGDMDV